MVCGGQAEYDETKKQYLSRCSECLKKLSDYKYMVRHGMGIRLRRHSFTKSVALKLGKRPLCKYCGGRTKRINGVICGSEECKRKYKTEHVLKTKKIWKSLGLCSMCGKEHATIGNLCIECAERNREHARRVRSERKSKGVCVICGNAPATRGVCCEKCADRNNQAAKEYQRKKKVRH